MDRISQNIEKKAFVWFQITDSFTSYSQIKDKGQSHLTAQRADGPNLVGFESGQILCDTNDVPGGDVIWGQDAQSLTHAHCSGLGPWAMSASSSIWALFGFLGHIIPPVFLRGQILVLNWVTTRPQNSSAHHWWTPANRCMRKNSEQPSLCSSVCTTCQTPLHVVIKPCMKTG